MDVGQGRLPPGEEARNEALDRRLERVGWALLLIMIGGIGLVPRADLPPGTWLIGAGVILLGLALLRRLLSLPAGAFRIAFGAAALALGLSDLLGVAFPVWQTLLVLIGASMLVGAFSMRDRRARNQDSR